MPIGGLDYITMNCCCYLKASVVVHGNGEKIMRRRRVKYLMSD